MNIDDIRRAWSRETSADPDRWVPEDPSWGQCAVTALVVQDYYGGVLLRSLVSDGSHYWNLLDDGTEIDLTREQFPAGIAIPPGEPRGREYVLSFPETRARYELLKSLVGRD